MNKDIKTLIAKKASEVEVLEAARAQGMRSLFEDGLLKVMKRCFAVSIILSTIVGASLFIISNEASAMPAFARKYNAPCSSCHIAFPKLNDFGIAFKQRGYRKEDEGPGESVWKLKHIPVGGMVQVAYESKNDEGSDPKRSSEANVSGVEFFFGGVLGPNISFFGDFGSELDEDGELESITPDLAFVIFNDLISEGHLNLKLGGFDVDFPFLSDPRSITLAPYLARISADGEEGVSMGKRGVEVNGYFEDTGTRYAAGIANATDLQNATNNLQALYAWFTQTFELMGFDQTLGVILSLDKNGDEAAGTDDGTQAYGGVFDLHYGLTGLILAYHHYTGGVSEGEVKVDSLLVELLHSFTQNLVGVARFDSQDTSDTDEEKVQLTVDLQYFFHPNVKGQAEFSQLTETDAAGEDTGVQTVTLAVTFGF